MMFIRQIQRGGFTLVELLAAISIVALLATILIPALARSGRHEKVTACTDQLKALHKAQAAFRATGPQGQSELGRSFWFALSRTNPPLITRDALRCPLVDPSDMTECHYMGPAVDVTTLGPRDALGCDLERNHSENGEEGGNILYLSGEVETDHGNRWLSIRGSKCRP